MPLLPPRVRGTLDNASANVRARWHLREATSLGARVRLWGVPRIKNEGTLIIGDRVRLSASNSVLELGVGPGAVLEIGAETFINHGTSIAAMQSVRIGPRCSIGPFTLIMDNDFHRIEPERRNELPESSPIVIEENVWLGARVVVLRGVTIGAGSVVGVGSIVAHDVPPRSLAIGSPAKVIRSL